MQYRRLGRTGLNLSVLSLGSGGPNRFGQWRYVPRKDICELVRRALDLGINYFDTASGYSDSESILGEALRGIPREGYYLSSKVFPLHENGVISAAEARQLVQRSLRRLGAETLDILFFHRVPPEFYEETLERLAPTVQSLRAEGKIRHIGITESSTRDREHTMLKRALREDLFDAIMVAYDITHCSADEEVLPMALDKDVGVIGMVAARNLVPGNASERRKLCAVLSTARKDGEGFLELPSAGYTFAVSHPALASVLTGTTDPLHLEQNVKAALAPALTSKEIDQLRKLLQVAEGSD